MIGIDKWLKMGKKECMNKSASKNQKLPRQLLKEWHPIKNGNLDPMHFTTGSHEKVWWYLPFDDLRTGKHFDFEWQARINLRNKGNGCPFLSSGDKVWEGFNDLQSCRPDLAQEWINEKNKGLLPNEVREHSNKKVW